MKESLLIIIFLFSLNFYSQTQEDDNGRKNAEEELKIALKNRNEHNVIDNKSLLIEDKGTAIKIAETILFSVYGKDNIEEQKPYEIYLIKKYWIISGVLPEDYVGGTFLIIIDATNSKIIKITHGK